jgi:hypothetical protein
MRGWLAVPLIGSDEANLVRLASLTSTALDALAQLHLPEHRTKVAQLPA